MKTNAIANAFPGKHRLSPTDDAVLELADALEAQASFFCFAIVRMLSTARMIARMISSAARITRT